MFELLDHYPQALPIVIFCGRICDVSLGTLRIIFVARGIKKIAPFIGFGEVFIWIVIISQMLSRADSIVTYVAYAGGYAAGTFVGLLIEEKINYGLVAYRVFTRKNGFELSGILSGKGYRATVLHGEVSAVAVDVVEAVISRKDAKILDAVIKDFDPESFCVIEDVRAKQYGLLPGLLTRK